MTNLEMYDDHRRRHPELYDNGLSSSAVAEPIVRHEPVGEKEGEDCHPPRYGVRITSFRKRSLDPDNLTGGTKYFVDGLRHAGLIPDDRPEDISLEVLQRKVKSKHDERTMIEIIPVAVNSKLCDPPTRDVARAEVGNYGSQQ